MQSYELTNRNGISPWVPCRDKIFGEFKRRVKRLTARSWRVSMSHRIQKLNEFLGGWMGSILRDLRVLQSV
ncbi:MAG: hypothetical protein K9N55_21010 [Phycisphaerae bacterium]|nr:hypothetical protein [Phycisphaerae bacterium]